jgi:hypothetical protein
MPIKKPDVKKDLDTFYEAYIIFNIALLLSKNIDLLTLYKVVICWIQPPGIGLRC